MQLTIITGDKEQIHYTCSEVEIETEDGGMIGFHNAAGRSILDELPFFNGGECLRVIEDGDKTVQPEAKRVTPFPYIIVRLDTFQQKNLLEREFALSKLNEDNKVGIPVVLFEYDEREKHYRILYLSTI